MPRPFLAPAAALLGLLVALLLPAAASAALTIAPASEPVRERAFDLTVSGTTATPGRNLYVWTYADGAAPCPGGPGGGGSDREVAPDAALPVGSWTKTVRVTFDGTGPYRVCAWVKPHPGSPTTDDTGETTITTREPTASIALTVPAESLEQRQVTLTATGTSEAERRAYVVAMPGDVPCAATVSAQDPANPYATYPYDTVADAFTVTRPYVPVEGVNTVCGWVATGQHAAPVGAGRATFTARASRASVGVSGPATMTNLGAGKPFTVAGATENGRQLWIIRSETPGCAPVPRAQPGSWIVAGENVGPGAFSKTVMASGVPGGRYSICAYVGREARPDATARWDYGVTLDPSLDEERDAEGDDPVTPAALLAPVDLLRTRSMKPAFTWRTQSWKGEDTLVLASVARDGKQTRLVDLGPQDAVVHHGKKRVKAKTSTLARATQAGDDRTLRLKQSVPPGDYVWWVARTALDIGEPVVVPSVQRRLTVEGEKLRGRLATRVQRKADRFRALPGWSAITVRTAPYARVRFTVRGRAGAGTYTTIADAEGYAVQGITWTCAPAGVTYTVGIRVSDQHGAAKTKRVVTRGPSRARCARLLPGTLTKAQIRKDLRKALADLRPKCAARGGVAVEVREPGRTFVDCRNPAGGYITIR